MPAAFYQWSIRYFIKILTTNTNKILGEKSLDRFTSCLSFGWISASFIVIMRIQLNGGSSVNKCTLQDTCIGRQCIKNIKALLCKMHWIDLCCMGGNSLLANPSNNYSLSEFVQSHLKATNVIACCVRMRMLADNISASKRIKDKISWPFYIIWANWSAITVTNNNYWWSIYEFVGSAELCLYNVRLLNDKIKIEYFIY